MFKKNKPLPLMFVVMLFLAVGLSACGSITAESKNTQNDVSTTALQEKENADQDNKTGEDNELPEKDNAEEMGDGSMESSENDDLKNGEDEKPQAQEPVEEMADDSSDMKTTPAFFSAVLTDPSTGQTFSIDDFKGEVVLVETLAMWCSNCFKQQNEVKSLHTMAGEGENFISLGLDIDPNENIDDLRGYVEKNGFDWTYAVAPVEVAREIGQLYGEQFLNPSATPMFIIDQHGEVHTLPFGIKSSQELLEALKPFLNENM